MDKELAEELLKSFRGAKEFALEQAPEVAKEMVRWAIGEGIVWCLALSVLAVLSTRWIRAFIRASKEDEDGTFDFLFLMAGLILGLMVLVVTPQAITQILQAWLAPRVYLIEKLSGIVAGNR